LPLELLMECEFVVANSRATRRPERACIKAGFQAPKTTFRQQNSVQLAGRVSAVRAGLHFRAQK
jgi:hypothetical protein